MGRPDGFLWFYPGFPSLSIAYHDTSDFYYSGHVGSCTMFLIENFVIGEKKMFYTTLFILINEWLVLTFTRTHYIIDMLSGLICAFLMHRISEHVAYIYDVRIIGARSRERDAFYYMPCKFCGWTNSDASHKICSQELALQVSVCESRILRESNSYSEKADTKLVETQNDNSPFDHEHNKVSDTL